MKTSPKQLFIADWDRLRIELAWAYEGEVSQIYREEISPHYGQSVFLIERGSVVISTPEGSVQGQAGQWVLPRQGKRHQKFSSDAKILSIHLDLHWPGGIPLFDWSTALIIPASEEPAWSTKARTLTRFIEREFSGVRWELKAKEASLPVWYQLQTHFSSWFDVFLKSLLARGHQPANFVTIDPRLLAGIELLDHQPFSIPYQERKIAAHAGLSVSQWNRLFLKKFSMTPRRYYDKRRLDSALIRVHGGGLLKEIAFDLGFRSLPHFSSWFRQKTGCTPTEFRQRDSGE